MHFHMFLGNSPVVLASIWYRLFICLTAVISLFKTCNVPGIVGWRSHLVLVWLDMAKSCAFYQLPTWD